MSEDDDACTLSCFNVGLVRMRGYTVEEPTEASGRHGGESVALDARRRFGDSSEGDWRWAREYDARHGVPFARAKAHVSEKAHEVFGNLASLVGILDVTESDCIRAREML